MTSLYRERFDLTLKHRRPDRPPMDLGATDMTEIEGGPRRLAHALGLSGGDGAGLDERVLRELDIDIRGVGGILKPASLLERRVSDTEFVDVWGIGYRFTGHHHEAVGRPLAGVTIDDLGRYPWPDPDSISAAAYTAVGALARQLYEHSPYVVCARHPCFGVMELACWMCGFEDLLYRMAAEPEFVMRLFEILFDYQKRVMERYYEAVGSFIHFTTSGDDFGTQTGPFVSPAMFRQYVAPFLAERVRIVRRHSTAAFFHHSCGAIHELIPDLIAAGVDILNPIQPRARNMEPERLKRDFGDRLTFYGGVDTQLLLPNGTPDEVAARTQALIATLGASGGYVLSAAHVIQSDVPVGNVLALYRSGREAACKAGRGDGR